MLSKTKIIFVAFFAAVAISATVASTASADEWFVNGSKLTTTAQLSTAAAVDTAAVLAVPSIKIRLMCTGPLFASLPLIKGSAIKGEGTEGQAESLTFTGCSVLEPANCEIKSGTGPPITELTTEPVLTLARLNAKKEVVIRFKPSGKTFITIPFGGSGCSISGEDPLSGEITVRAPTGNTENTVQPIEGLGTTENNSLEFFSGKAFFEGGRALLKLQSGLKWSFHA